jgi:hypothetical protein
MELYLINKLKPKYNLGGLAEDHLTYNLPEPQFEEMWVGAVYDKNH